MNFCTIIAKNYVAHARVLAESVREHHPDAACVVLVIDEPAGHIDPEREQFELVSAGDLGIDGFERMAAMYDVLELSTAVKPWLLRHMLDRFDGEGVVYLDPDIRLYSPLAELDSLIKQHKLVLTPHVTTPMPRDGKRPSERDILIAGIYNLGFLALGDGPSTQELLDWWSERLSTDCISDPGNALFVDQRWIDFVPGIVPDYHVLRDPGYNVAYWNLPGRELERANGHYRVAEQPLRFFHFSGFSPDDRGSLSIHQDRIHLTDDPVLARICKEYADELVDLGFQGAKQWPYDYDRLRSGIRLDRLLRRLYRQALMSGELEQSIFTPGGERAFLAWLNEPAPAGAAAGVTRYLCALHSWRPDVQRAFPDLDGGGGPSLVQWAMTSGRREVPIPDELLPVESHAAEAVPAPAADDPGETSKMPFGVNVTGYLRSETGIGEVARQVITALDAQRVPLLPFGVHTPWSRQDHEYTQTGSFDGPFGVNIVCVNADLLPQFARDVGGRFFEGRYSIGFWWWEASKFPDEWLESFESLDEIWVGSQFVAEALAPISPIPVVRVRVPVAVPPTPPVERSALGLPEDFTFLLAFDYHSVFRRKNPLALVEAFKTAFEPGAGASLVIKCVNHEEHASEHLELQEALRARPDVHLIERYMSAREKNQLIASCDCFASLHRSEGFGLMLAEAMFLGKAAIATAYSGNLDYMTERNSYLVNYELVRIGEGAGPYPPAGEWAEPDVDHAAHLMRHVFEHREEARERGARAAEDMRRDHSPEAAGALMHARLERVRAHLAGRPPPRTGLTDALADVSAEDTLARIASGPQRKPRPTLGPLGRVARKVVLRLMKPYTVHQAQVSEELGRAIQTTHESLSRVAPRIELQSTLAYAELLAELRRQRERGDGMSAHIEGLDPHVAALGSQLNALAPHVAGLDAWVGNLGPHVEALESQVRDIAPHLKGLDVQVVALTGGLQEMGVRTQAADRLVQETRALPYMSDPPFEAIDHPIAGAVYGYRGYDSNGDASDSYLEFQNVFRGSEEFIRERQRRYLELIGERQPVLDVGCGRGEFLDLLRERGLEYLGIDDEPSMVERCRAKGHERVEQARANDYLSHLDDGQLGVVFCSHALEHFEPGEIVRFLELSRSKLRMGGQLIVETVNPHSFQALKTFWVDPTHQRPLFPEALLALCRGAGFGSAFVFHPNGSGDVESDRYREGEYAVVAQPAP